MANFSYTNEKAVVGLQNVVGVRNRFGVHMSPSVSDESGMSHPPVPLPSREDVLQIITVIIICCFYSCIVSSKFIFSCRRCSE